MHLARTLAVSSLVLLSSSTLADAVLAGEGAQLIEFTCDVPLFGSNRCGSPDRNVRVGGNKKLNVQVRSAPAGRCVTFTVYHAVENKKLVTSREICPHEKATELWPNLKDEGVDVFMIVKSVDNASFTITGTYIIE
jgi:hypothetical protein